MVFIAVIVIVVVVGATEDDNVDDYKARECHGTEYC